MLISFAESENSCIARLAEMFEQGTTQTSASVLFDGMDVAVNQKHALCESLKARGLINAAYQMGQQLPYSIEILPASKSERDSLTQANKTPSVPSEKRGIWDTIYGIALLWFGDPSARFAKFFAIAGLALIAAPWWQPILQQLAVHRLGLPEGFLENADRAMFWSGWVLIAIALTLYVWVKQLPTRLPHHFIDCNSLAEFIEIGQRLRSRANEEPLPIAEHNGWVNQVEEYFTAKKRRDYIVRLNDFSGMVFYGDGSDKSEFEKSIDGRICNLKTFISELAKTRS